MMEWNSQDGIAKLLVGLKKKITQICSSGSLSSILGIVSCKDAGIPSEVN